MTDKSLRLQILEYLKNKGGAEKNIDIKASFLNKLIDLQGRSDYKETIEKLAKDEFIELVDTTYGLMTFQSGGVLRSIDEISIKARLLPKGERYLREIAVPNQPKIGNVHIGDNYGNYNQLLESQDTSIAQTAKPKIYLNTKSNIASIIESIGGT